MATQQAPQWSQIKGWSGLGQYRKPEELLAAFFSASKVGFAIVDDQLRYQVINDALAAMNGIPAADHLGKSVREVLGEAASHVEPMLHRVLLSGEPVLDAFLTTHIPARRSVGHWILHFFPLRDRSGKINGIGEVVSEITEQKALQDKFASVASKLQQEKERLEMLLEISTAVTSSADLQEVFPAISSAIRRIVQQDWTNVSILEKSNLMRMYAIDFPLEPGLIPQDALIPLTQTASGLTVLEGRPKIFTRDELSAVDSPFLSRLLNRGIQSACCVPLITPRGTIGSFNLASRKEDAFYPEDIGMLQQIAALLATALDNTKAHSEIEELTNRLTQEVRYNRNENHVENKTEIIGDSPALVKALQKAKTVAPSDATVLILGESGTGKELLAHAIHRLGLRRSSQLIKLSCAAIPSALLEDELLGHEEGAFAGAISKRIGLLELADGGTLFLDEVGYLPLHLQTKLLRALQDGEFERLGSTETVRVDVRLLASTSADLGALVSTAQFRSDLYHRLNVFSIRMPTLRERPQDIPLLVRFFVKKYARRTNKNCAIMPTGAMDALLNWNWPGNVRELENFIERAVILSNGPILNVPIKEISC